MIKWVLVRIFDFTCLKQKLIRPITLKSSKYHDIMMIVENIAESKQHKLVQEQNQDKTPTSSRPALVLLKSN